MTFIQFCEAVSDEPLTPWQKDYLSGFYRSYRDDPVGFRLIMTRRGSGKTRALTQAYLLLNEYLEHQYEGGMSMPAEAFELKTLREEFPNAFNSEIIYSFKIKKLNNGTSVLVKYDDEEDEIVYPENCSGIVRRLIDELTICALEGSVS